MTQLSFTNFDSIQNIEERIKTIYSVCWREKFVQPGEVLKLAEDTYQFSIKEKSELGEAISLSIIGFQHWHLSKIDLANNELSSAVELLKALGAYHYIGNSFMALAMVNWGLGNREKAFNIIYEGIALLDEKNIETSKFWMYWALGVYYFDMEDYTKSIEFYEKSEDLFKLSVDSDKGDKCFILIGLGSVHQKRGEYEKALSYFEKVKDVSIEVGQWMQEARACFEIASICKLTEQYTKAEEYFVKSYLMRKEHNTKPAMISCLLEYSDLLIQKGDNSNKALELLEEALSLALETNSKQKLHQCHFKLAEIYKSQNKYELALSHMESFYTIKSELSGDQASNNLKKLETKFATESAEKEAEIHKLINIDLKVAHDDLEEKNNEILDSIHYAKRIQLALFPPHDLIKKHLKNHFLYYQPKDIVGGDFYWMETVGDKVFFAIADCTGHGVPGALLSVMCSTVLTKSVRELGITQPSLILDESVNLLQERFVNSTENVSDGMDISLCCFDLNENVIEYAGANNSLYFVRDGELNEIKADKQPIGYYEHRKPYTNHEVQLQKNDQFYLFSDGYADQFGGEKGKKLKTKPFKELLMKVNQLPMDEQKGVVENHLNSWKGDLSQVDDICIFSVKL